MRVRRSCCATTLTAIAGRRRLLTNTVQLISASLLAEGTVSVPAIQPHRQHRLHPGGGHTGGPVRVLEALRRAVIGHRQLALLGGQVLSTATECSDQDGRCQEKEGTPGSHNVIPVDGQGRHRNASPWWRDTE